MASEYFAVLPYKCWVTPRALVKRSYPHRCVCTFCVDESLAGLLCPPSCSFLRFLFISVKHNISSMIKTHISISLDDVALLRRANQKFGCGDKVSSSELVGWAVHMFLVAYEHEAK